MSRLTQDLIAEILSRVSLRPAPGVPCPRREGPRSTGKLPEPPMSGKVLSSAHHTRVLLPAGCPRRNERESANERKRSAEPP